MTKTTNPFNHPYPHAKLYNVKLTPFFAAAKTPKPERFNRTTNPLGHPFPHHKVTRPVLLTPPAWPKPCTETLSMF